MRGGRSAAQGTGRSGKFEHCRRCAGQCCRRTANLQACGGCDVRFAATARRRSRHHCRGAKVSKLILNMNIYLRRRSTADSIVTLSSADLRGKTDESLVARDELSSAQPLARADTVGRCRNNVLEQSGFQARGVPAQMIAHEGGDEVVAVVVASLAAQGERDAGLVAGGLQQLGSELLRSGTGRHRHSRREIRKSAPSSINATASCLRQASCRRRDSRRAP